MSVAGLVSALLVLVWLLLDYILVAASEVREVSGELGSAFHRDEFLKSLNAMARHSPLKRLRLVQGGIGVSVGDGGVMRLVLKRGELSAIGEVDGVIQVRGGGVESAFAFQLHALEERSDASTGRDQGRGRLHSVVCHINNYSYGVFRFFIIEE